MHDGAHEDDPRRAAALRGLRQNGQEQAREEEGSEVIDCEGLLEAVDRDVALPSLDARILKKHFERRETRLELARERAHRVHRGEIRGDRVELGTWATCPNVRHRRFARGSRAPVHDHRRATARERISRGEADPRSCSRHQHCRHER
jgi:hypothetical protein